MIAIVIFAALLIPRFLDTTRFRTLLAEQVMRITGHEVLIRGDVSITLLPMPSVVFRQVVGILARRIVCRVREGQELERGERVGLMRFGSRMDVFLPEAATLRVSVGDRVVGGETILATLGSPAVG